MSAGVKQVHIHTCTIALHLLYIDPQPGDLVVYAESQTKQFRSFLLRANRYPSLLVGGASGCGLNKKIVIVEVGSHVQCT